MDTCRVTKGCMSNLGMGVTIAHRAAPAFPNILTYLWAKSYGHFCSRTIRGWKVRKYSWDQHIFMSQPRGVTSQTFMGPKTLGWAKMFDFRRTTVFCLGHLFSKQKMTGYTKTMGT